jgi:Domain of unknown function (DUF3883)
VHGWVDEVPVSLWVVGTPDVTAADIVGALDEFDDLGRTAFLGKYQFGQARRYFLRRNGRDYDSKAVVGAAHTRSHGEPLRAADFSGGEATVKRLLEQLGFDVVTHSPSAPPGAVTPESLGAWVVRCNPDVWDLRRFRAGGHRVIDNWTVKENYRSELMREAQRVLLWVTGPAGGDLPRGLWGSGWITGEVRGRVERDTERDADGVEYWLDQPTSARMRFVAPMRLRLWDAPILESDILRIEGLEQLEVIRMRQVANLSWVSTQQLALLDSLLPPWPQPGPPAADVVTVAASGAGFGDPVTRAVVEAAAITAVRDHYESRGFSVESVEADKCGWDLTCTADSGIVRVEVKGVSGPKRSVLLTRNEYRSAVNDPGWVLAVVTRALAVPTVTIHTAEEVRAAAEPFVHIVDLTEHNPS